MTKKNLKVAVIVVALVAATATGVWAATPDSTSVVAEAAESVASSGNTLVDWTTAIILALIVLVFPLWMIGHMLYVILFTRALKSTPSVEAMQQKRASKGLPDQATTSETAQCLQLLNEAWLTFSVMGKGENGEDTRSPKKMRELLNARKLVAQAGKLLPTDAEAHAEYAKYRQFLYDNLKRTFFSSWKLIILALIVAVGLAFLSGGKNDEQGFFYNFFTPGLPMFFWIPAIVYYISGNVPQFMIDQKAQRGGGGGWFASALVGLGLGALGSGYTVRTTYTDGSHEDDNSAHWIALMIGAVILFIVACTIYIWAIINYLRNYVLYI